MRWKSQCCYLPKTGCFIGASGEVDTNGWGRQVGCKTRCLEEKGNKTLRSQSIRWNFESPRMVAGIVVEEPRSNASVETFQK